MEKQKEPRICYTKEQLLESKKFAGRRDILSALLREDSTYTMKEAEKIVSSFLAKRIRTANM